MAEGISSSYTQSLNSIESRQKMFSDIRELYEKQSQQRFQKTSSDKSQAFLTNDMANIKKSEAFSKTDEANTKRAEADFANVNANRAQVFLTEEMLPEERPEVFIQKTDTENVQSPFELPERKEEETEAIKAITLPENDAVILSELQRNPMRTVLTARDIAEDFDISYQKAIDIFKALNADANGVAREFNLPDENATVSYLV